MDIEIKMKKLDGFRGNILGAEEKLIRMDLLAHEIARGDIDLPFIPYLHRLNQYCVMTTQCCDGRVKGRRRKRAYLDFRSMMPVEVTVNHMLRPIENRFPECSFSIYTEAKRLRYCIWMDNKEWEEVMEYFLNLLDRMTQRMMGNRVTLKKRRLNT